MAIGSGLEVDRLEQETVVAGQSANGYEPVTPNPAWAWGYVEDPRLFRGRVRELTGMAALALVAAVAWALTTLHADPIQVASVCAIVLVGGFTAIHQQLAALASAHDAKLARGQPVRVFNAVVPAEAMLAYRRAKASRQFDDLVIYCPLPEAFREAQATHAPSLGLLDPLLVGRVQGQCFLVAQWGLAEDLPLD